MRDQRVFFHSMPSGGVMKISNPVDDRFALVCFYANQRGVSA